MTNTNSIKDLFKGSVVDQFSSGTLTIPDLLLSIGLAFVVGMLVFYVYKSTFTGVLYSRNFNVSLVLLTMVTTLIIRTVTANLALSLGMVGALSIVRFRTAVKDPMDTVFMFWAVGVGITIGAGFYFLAAVGSLAISAFVYVMYLIRGHGSYAYLLIVRHDFESTNEVSYALRKLPKGSRLKSKTVSGTGVEITMEVRLPGENTNIVTELLRIEGVFDATLVSYQGDYAA
jgi:hypothetical protein